MVVKDDNLDRADFGGEKNRKEHTIVFEKETFFSLAKVGGWDFNFNFFPRGNAELSSQTSPWSLSCSSMGLWGGYLFLIYPFKTMTTFDANKNTAGASTRWPPASLYWTKPASTILDSRQKSVLTCSTMMQTTQLSRSFWFNGCPVQLSRFFFV